MSQYISTLRRIGADLALVAAVALAALSVVTPAVAAAPARWAPELTSIPFCTDQTLRPSTIARATFQRSVEQAVALWNAAGAQMNATYTGDCGPDTRNVASKPIRIGFNGSAHGAVGSEAGQTMLVIGASPQERIVEAQINIDQGAATMAPACLAHIVIHETGHALGLEHSSDPADIMYPTFDPQHPASCKTSPSPNEYAAIRALYGSSSTSRTPSSPIVDQGAATASQGGLGGTGRLVSAPVFDPSGVALAVIGPGSLAQIEASARAAGATAIWVQDASGQFHALVIGAPAFVNADFQSALGGGFTTSTSVTLTRASSSPIGR